MNQNHVFQEIVNKYSKLYHELKYNLNYSYYNDNRVKELDNLKNSFSGTISEYEKLKEDIYVKFNEILEENNKEYENNKNNIFNEFKKEIIKQSKLNEQDAEKTFDMAVNLTDKLEKDFNDIAICFGNLEEYVTSLSIKKVVINYEQNKCI